MLIFISGGVRSGKSKKAEEIIRKLSQKNRVYIATSIPYDQEMKERVKAHKKMRQGQNWTTYEQAYDVGKLCQRLSKDDAVLLDCLTLLLSNELFDPGASTSWEKVEEKILGDLQAIEEAVDTLVIVSNDLFSNLRVNDETTEFYLRILGRLHQEVVKRSDLAIECIAGISVIRKGDYL